MRICAAVIGDEGDGGGSGNFGDASDDVVNARL